jgi:hypothetical protein
MYLKFATTLPFPDLAQRIAPEQARDSIGWDYENVYEWMWIDLDDLPFALNVSRAHGDDDEPANPTIKTANVRKARLPGDTYVTGWNRATDSRVDILPAWLPQYLASRLQVSVLVFAGCMNVDVPDLEPLSVIKPN